MGRVQTHPFSRPGVQDLDMEVLPYSLDEEQRLIQITQTKQETRPDMNHQNVQYNHKKTNLQPASLSLQQVQSPPSSQPMQVQYISPTMNTEEQHFHMEQFNQPSQPLPLKRADTYSTREVSMHPIYADTQGREEDEISDSSLQIRAISVKRREEGGYGGHNNKGEERGIDHTYNGRRRDEASTEINETAGEEQRQQHGGRPSGWDVPTPRFGALCTDCHEDAVFGTGSSDDRRCYSKRKMTIGPSVRRNKRQTMVGCPYPPPCKRERTTMDAGLNPYRIGKTTSFQGENKTVSNVQGDTAVVSKTLHDEDMEFDRATVPAHKAPQMP